MRGKKIKVSLSSVDTTGTRALTCSKDRAMYIVLGKMAQAYLEKVTLLTGGKYWFKHFYIPDFYIPGLVGEF